MSVAFETWVRSNFPAVASAPEVLFDNAGGTAPCAASISATTAYMSECPVQLGGSYALSNEAGRRVLAAHELAAKFVDPTHAVLAKQIAFGPSSTALFNALSASLAHEFAAGDEIIVTNFDHESNIGAWRRLEALGVKIVEWQLGTDQRAHIGDLKALLGPRTRLVAFTHCSNILGTVTDIEAACRVIREAGAISVVDGVAFAPHRALDVVRWDVDFYIFSFYKVFGPHVGCLYASTTARTRPRNLNHFFHDDSDLATRLQPGACPYELVAGTAGVSHYLRALANEFGDGAMDAAWQAIETQEQRLMAPVIRYLSEHDDFELYGSGIGADRLPVIAFNLRGRPAAAGPQFFDPHKIALRDGHFYAPRLMRALSLDPEDGVIRVSFAHYNQMDEVERLIQLLERYSQAAAA